MRSAVFAVVCLAVCAGTARANSITLSYTAGDGCSASVTGSGTLSYDNHTATSTGCTGTTFGAFTDVQLAASSFQFNVYFASTGTTDTAQRTAFAQVFDTITITGGTGSGTLVLPWTLDGTLQGGTPDPVFVPSYYANLFMFGPNGGANFIACDLNVPGTCGATGTVTVNQVTNFSLPFTYGTPVQLNWYIQAVLASGCVQFNSCTPLGNTGSGTIDFYNTATLLPLQVFNASGAQNFNAIVTGEDGGQYVVETAPSAVPEPGTLALVSLGALVAAHRVRARRRQR